MQKLISLALFALTSCATLPNAKVCTTAGRMNNGAICAFTLEDRKEEMTVDQYLDFLEPFEGSQTEPPRAGAMCMSAVDFSAMKTALDQACRLLSSRCRKADVTSAIRRLDSLEKRSLEYEKESLSTSRSQFSEYPLHLGGR